MRWGALEDGAEDTLGPEQKKRKAGKNAGSKERPIWVLVWEESDTARFINKDLEDAV